MKEILEIGGSGFLIPAVLFVLMLYAAKGLYGLVGHRSRHRKEFLDLWDPVRAQDDLWLEVIVRHHFGTTMPAGIVRVALAQPDKCLALFELCELWPLFRYDRDSQAVSWRQQRYKNQKARRIERYMMIVMYPVLALISLGYVLAVPTLGPSSVKGWLYAFGGVAFAGWAIVAVARQETITMAADIGDEWIQRINEHHLPSQSSETSNT